MLFIDVCNPDGTLYDSVYETIGAIYDRVERYEPYFGGERIKYIGVYVSDYTRDYLYETVGHGGVGAYFRGIRSLTGEFQRRHVPADTISRLNLESLDDYALIILPNAFCMSDLEARAFEAYVHRGGRVVATDQSGFGTEEGDDRPHPALADLVGVARVERAIKRRAYAKLPTEFLRSAGVAAWDQEVALRSAVVIEAAAGRDTRGEIVLPRDPLDGTRRTSIFSEAPEISTGAPAVLFGSYGAGRTCYCAGDFCDADYTEPFRVLASLAIELLSLGSGPAKPPLEGDAPPTIFISALCQTEVKRSIVHLVNYQDSAPFIPATDVRCLLRTTAPVGRVRLLPDGPDLDYRADAEGIEFVVPLVETYAAVALEDG